MRIAAFTRPYKHDPKITYGLSGDTSGDDNDLRALKSLLETIVLRSKTSNLKERTDKQYVLIQYAKLHNSHVLYLGVGVDVAMEHVKSMTG
jgi:hypothetical protein